MRLNLGCGRNPLDGWTNVDISDLPGVDLVADLDGPDLATVLDADSVDESVGSHVIEHLRNPLPFMEALWTVTKPGGTVTFEVPYGSSDDAWEDPTHVRPYFLNSWGYFSQPFYFRADYGYRGDWRVESVVLAVDAKRWKDDAPAHVMDAVMTERNVVQVMRATLSAVKPARPPERDLQDQTPVQFALVST